MHPSETVVDLFIRQAKKTPEMRALKFKESELSYKQLDELSSQVANHLIALGIKPETPVPVCLKNPLDMVIAIWGILKAGGAFVPMDAEFPAHRLRYMIENTGAPLIITDSSCTHFLAGVNSSQPVVYADNNWSVVRQQPGLTPDIPLTGEQLAYMIYTSGSTGLPKGVMIKHKSLSNFIQGLTEALPYDVCENYALGPTFAADFVIAYLFTSLTQGSTLHLFTKDDYNDVEYLHHYFDTHKIDCINIVPSHWKSLSLNGKDLMPRRILKFAGEALHTEMIRHILPASSRDCMLVNIYGPTETTVGQLLHIIDGDYDYPASIPIGKPFAGASAYLLDEQGEEVKGEGIGELYISGVCVAKGYLNKPELTAERFVKNRFSNEPGYEIMYCTGDIVRRLPGGNIDFIGRADDQVKIRGFRIEPGEIENTLQAAPGVKQCVILAKEASNGDKRLIGYVVCPDEYDKAAIIHYLRERLPDYMVPQLWVRLSEFPFLVTGKVDKKALPNPDASTLLTYAYVSPVSKTEKLLAELWKELLSVERTGAEDNFFELGGTSLLALKTVAALKQQHQINLPVVKLYQFPKIKDLAAFIDGRKRPADRTSRRAKNTGGDVAVIGMAGRFPGADSIEELWELLKKGKETATFFNDDELDRTIPDVIKNNPDYVKSRGIINGVKEFDAAFFGINPTHAKLMDPQQRVFLEIAWEALEQSGYSRANTRSSIGVFAGVNINTYYTHNVLTRPDLIENAGNLQTTLLNDKDYVASRTSYSFDLKGPAVNVQTACSTSLVAIVQAVQSIRNGQCDMALAGGASIHAPVHSGHLYEEGAMFSKDGHCRPFDAAATGTSFSDGAGVVLLKDKAQAIQDGDTIYGIIKGIGLSNDGGGKGSFMAPSAEGQAAAISMAIDDAGIDAKEISYIEAHGTATPLGDPIEIEGLNIAFGKQPEKQYCAIGSVKGNFGHLTIAAGVTGLIKTCLSLYHKKLLPSINYEKPNPHIDFKNSPFHVNTQLQDWKTDKKRIAGVSSFGVGGTNAHVILEEADVKPAAAPDNKTRSAQLLCWSAKTEKSLDNYGDYLSGYFSRSNINLADVAFTLNTSRRDFEQKRFIVATDTDDLAGQLADKNHLSLYIRKLTDTLPRTVFIFPGQGDQYVNMCRSLYRSESVFKAAVDECAVLLKEELNENLLDILYPGTVNEAAREKIKQTRYSQPALFTVGYALGKLWMSWGVYPAAFTGHSIGEFVAAYFAGVFSLKDALKLIAARGRMMDDLPRGSMLSVRLSQKEVQPYLNNTIELAAVNSPQLCVVAGTNEAISQLSKALDAKDIPNRVLATSHAFHSYMMDDVVTPFEEVVRTISLNEPLVPIASSVTGEWLQPAEATSAHYWAKHLRKPVLFGRAVQKLLDESYNLFLELGPGKSVATLVRQQAIGKNITVISSIEKEEAQLPSDQAIMKALGQLWLNGVAPDWNAFYQDETRTKCFDLPAYAFDRQEYWIDALMKDSVSSTAVETPGKTEQGVEMPLSTVSKKEQFTVKIKEILETASGIDVSTATGEMSFIQMGLDSLSLTQVALMLKKRFAVSVTFRQLNESLGTIGLLANYLEANLKSASSLTKAEKKISLASELSTEEEKEIKKPFGAIARIEKKAAVLNNAQQEYLDELTSRYNQKTKRSKEYTQQHRMHMADPRVVSGFKPATKELAYSIVIKKSKGARLWDIDGNEYVDALNGFGSSLLGYQPDFLKKALIEQVENGYEIGPQHELAGEVCRLICEFTRFDRSALCNTGSEAVLGAMRIARTVTGRSLIVAFTNSYHGIMDEVIARSSRQLKTYPAAPGIMPEAVQNMLFLDYGAEESLRIIEERSGEIAAVLVEPVQSRRCDFQPIAFLKQLRKITAAAGTVLIFDEVISGFRFHPGGVQAMFGIQADIATYGKVVGGGMSVGVIAGKKQYMDALDGGWWQFGDDSMPEAGVTYFAGTFVRHPLALATTKATLDHLKQQGPSLQQSLNSKGKYLADALNAICRKLDVPMYIAQFASIWRIHFTEEYPFSELLFVLMRLKGIHILEGFPCFITTAHTEAGLQAIIGCFEESVLELKQQQLIPYYKHPMPDKNKYLNTPPAAHARLGRDKDGNPAWFVPDEANPGRWLQVVDAE